MAGTSLSQISVSEILSEIMLLVTETIDAAKASIVQKENFNRFSAFLKKICFILKDLTDIGLGGSDYLKQALHVLSKQVSAAKLMANECSSRNKIYLLLNSRNIVKDLAESTKEISSTLSLIPLASVDVPSVVNHSIDKISKSMMEPEYPVPMAEEEILEEILSGVQNRNFDRFLANDLLIRIADCVGISTERSALRKEYEGLKIEMENVGLRKDVAEALQIEQMILLLGKADVIATPEERERKYLDKRNSLSRQPLEPLQSFYCPITGDIMEDPVETPCGHSFERTAIEMWLAEGNNHCPISKAPLRASSLRSNRTLKQSIEEWKNRNTMIIIGSMKSKVQSNDVQEVIHYLEKLRNICAERYMHREWVVMEDYIPTLVTLLPSKTYEIRSLALHILCILANDSDDRKVAIAKTGNAIELVVFSLARKVEESKFALRLLLELSRSDAVRSMIGSIRGCILLLVNMSGGDDGQAAEDAHKLLENLSFLHQNIVQMAKANYFRHLLSLLSTGCDSIQKDMAKILSEIEMTDHSKLSLFKDGALEPLLRMLSHRDIEMKEVAVSALESLSTIPPNGLQMIKEGAMGLLLEILFRQSLSLPSLVEQVVATILHLALSLAFQEIPESTSLLESEEDIFKFFSLISLKGPSVQENILRTFIVLCQNPSGSGIRTTLRKISAVKVLVQLCDQDNQTVRVNAMKLFSCLTKDGDDITFSEHVGPKCVSTLLSIIQSSNDMEETVAAMEITANLPRNSEMTKLLLDGGALQVIVASISTQYSFYRRELIVESALKALCRFTLSTNIELQKKAAETGIIPVLVQLLVSGTPLMKQQVAYSLGQFSESSSILSRTMEKKGLFRCCLGSAQTRCTVHFGVCTLEPPFCLVQANALRPLVRVLGETDVGACEASLEAILTLINGELLQNGAKVIDEADAIAPMVKLLSSSCSSLQEKALAALEKIFRLPEFKFKYGKSAQMPLVEITQSGSRGRKSLAAKALAHLNVLPEQSSFF